MRVRRADGTPAVLKLASPGEAARREAEALRAFAGRGSVTLLDYEPSVGALLLTRAEPGHALAGLCETDDARATEIAAGVIDTLVRKSPRGVSLPSIDLWLSDLETTWLPLASDARAVAAELRASRTSEFVLHGDLHQFNILAAGDGWLSIDPKGVIGERECEIAPLILNPIAMSRSSVDRRMHQLCERLTLDRQRAYAWTFVRVVLAIVWSIEDDGHAPAEWIACAEHLRL